MSLVFLVLAILPITQNPTNDIKLFIYQISASVLCGAWLIGVNRNVNDSKGGGLFAALLLSWLALLVFTSTLSNFPLNSSVQVSNGLALVAIYFVTKQVVDTANHCRQLMAVMCVAVALSSMYAFMQAAGLDPINWSETSKAIARYDELPGTFGNPNFAAHVLTLVIFVAGYLAMYSQTRWCAVLIPIFCVHLYFTHNRAGWIAIFSALVLMAATITLRRLSGLNWKMKAALKPSLIGVVVVFSVIGSVTIWNGNREIVPLDSSILIRYNAYFGASRMIAEQPWFGFGPGNYAIESPQYWTVYEQQHAAERRLISTNVHNDFLESWIESGIVGAFLYVAILLSGILGGIYAGLRCKDNDKRRLGLLLGSLCCVFAVDGVFSFNFRMPVSVVTLFVILGMFDGVLYADRSKRQDRVPFHTRTPIRVAILLALAANALYTTNLFASKLLLRAGISAIHLGDHQGAKPLLRASMAMASHHPAPFKLMGDIELREGNSQKAAQSFQAALARRPNSLNIILAAANAELVSARRGDSFHRRAALDRAYEHAHRAEQLCPYLAQTHTTLALIHVGIHNLNSESLGASNVGGKSSNHLQQARHHLNLALYWGADNPSAIYHSLSEVDLAQNDLAAAEENLRKAVSMDVVAAQAWKSYFELTLEQDRSVELIEALDRSIQRHTKQPDSIRKAEAPMRYWKGRVFEADQRAAEALAEFEAAVRLDVKNSSYWAAYGRGSIEANQADKVYKFVQDLLASGGHQVSTWPTEVQALTKMSDLNPASAPAAIDQLVGTIVKDTERIGGLRIAPETRWVIELIAPVIAQWDSPDAGLAVAKAGLLFEAVGDFNEANRLYELSLTKLDGEDTIPWRIRTAHVLSNLERHDEAVAIIQDELREQGNRIDLRLALARAFAAADLKSNAKLEYRDLLLRFRLEPGLKSEVERELNAL